MSDYSFDYITNILYIESQISSFVTVIFKNNTFKNNKNLGKYTKGGIIYIKNLYSLNLGSNPHSFKKSNAKNKIENSFSLQKGGTFHLQNLKYININNLSITNSQSLSKGGAIYSDNIKSLIIKYSNFTENASKNSQGGVLYLGKINTFSIDSSNFTKNTAKKGSCIHLETISPTTFIM